MQGTRGSSGIILIDLILAFALSAVFVLSITAMISSAAQSYEWASERSRLLTAYQNQADEFNDMDPYTSRSFVVSDAAGPIDLVATAHWYGNDRVETDITVLPGLNGNASSSDHIYNQTLTFTRLERYPRSPDIPIKTSPICTVNFSEFSPVGSYGFLTDQINTTSTDNAAVSTTPITLPINPLLPLTHLEVRDGIAYVSDDSSAASDPDLFVVDIGNPLTPSILSSINTGPGIVSFALAGNYIYAAADSSAGQLHVINVASLNNLNLIDKFKLPLPYATATEPVGSAIDYDSGTVYLGTDKWDGTEFNAIDVRDPTHPKVMDGTEIGAKVDDILVYRNNAYVASAGTDQLLVANINDPAHPQTLNVFTPSGWDRQEGRTISLFEDRLQLGRTSGGYDISQDHELFDWATTSLSTLTGQVSLNVPGGVYGIVADRTHVFAVTRTLGQEFSIFNAALATSSLGTQSLPVSPQSMTCDGSSLYILAHTAPVIYKVTFSNK